MKILTLSRVFIAVALTVGFLSPTSAKACAFCKMAALKSAPAMRTPTGGSAKPGGVGGAGGEIEGTSAQTETLTQATEYFKEIKAAEVVDKTRGTNRKRDSGITLVQSYGE